MLTFGAALSYLRVDMRLLPPKQQVSTSAVVFYLTHMILTVLLKWVLVQRLSQVDGVVSTTSWLGFRKQVQHCGGIMCWSVLMSWRANEPCSHRVTRTTTTSFIRLECHRVKYCLYNLFTPHTCYTFLHLSRRSPTG